MKITVKKEVFRKFPSGFRAAFLLITNPDTHTHLPSSQHLLEEMENLTRLLFQKESPKTHHLISPWAVLQQEFGKEACHYQTSLEKLITQVIRKKKLQTKNVLLNLLCYLSLKHFIPFALDDFHKIKGDLIFQLSTGQERASLLKKLPPNELYYHDQKHILGTKLDFWKSPFTKPDKKTTCYLVHLEALLPVTDKKLKEILQEAANLIKNFCGGKTRIFVLDKRKNSVKI